MNRPHARLLPVTLVAGALVAGALPHVARSNDSPPGEVESLATPASREAAHRALQWLVRHQRPDGAWHCDVGFKLNEEYNVEHSNKPHVGVTALAGTAFLASGSVPARGPYAKNVKAALDFILAVQDKDSGYISYAGTRMYSHAFATMFLAEVYGMSPDPRVRDALQQAVEFTYKAQNDQGGWRYVPNAEDSDMSITVCQVVALRAAKNKGIRVPKESIDKAVDYVLNSAVTTDHGRNFEPGAFLYQWQAANRQARAQTRTSYALTSAGLTTLYGAGLYNNADIRRFVLERKLDRYTGSRADRLPDFGHMLDYVKRHYRDEATPGRYRKYFFFYGNYYAAQAMFIAGGRHWSEFYPKLRDDLIRQQRPDGSWDSEVTFNGSGPPEHPMSTAIAAMLLQIPNNYLPIFQR